MVYIALTGELNKLSANFLFCSHEIKQKKTQQILTRRKKMKTTRDIKHLLKQKSRRENFSHKTFFKKHWEEDENPIIILAKKTKSSKQ